MSKTWFITGATRGLGLEIAKAALEAGHNVVASGRHRASMHRALGPDSERLLCLDLDVTNETQARTAVDAAIRKFGAIDVLVNNAGFGYLGYFEDSKTEDARAQLDTNLFGVLHVTRAALPHMRNARQGRIFNVSSLGGMLGAELGSLYCATKFAVEGFSECLAKEVAPFGIFVTILQPGPFRTDFLTAESARYAKTGLADYDERRDRLLKSTEQRNGKQPGDPVKLAHAILQLAEMAAPPLRFLGGSIAVNAANAKLAAWAAEVAAWRDLSLSTDGDYESTSVGLLLEQIK